MEDLLRTRLPCLVYQNVFSTLTSSPPVMVLRDFLEGEADLGEAVAPQGGHQLLHRPVGQVAGGGGAG